MAGGRLRTFRDPISLSSLVTFLLSDRFSSSAAFKAAFHTDNSLSNSSTRACSSLFLELVRLKRSKQVR